MDTKSTTEENRTSYDLPRTFVCPHFVSIVCFAVYYKNAPINRQFANSSITARATRPVASRVPCRTRKTIPRC